MVNVLLKNRNLNSKVHVATYNVLTRKFELDNGRILDRETFLKHIDFHHPLLKEPRIEKSKVEFHYQYDNVDELLRSVIDIYAALIQVDNPSECSFKINPSQNFQSTLESEAIFFSPNLHKPAKESIPIRQFNGLIRDLYKCFFEFSQAVHIQAKFSTDQLPKEIDADFLYSSSSSDILQLLKTPPSLQDYELRVIDPVVGCGIFARKSLSKGTCVGLYTGVKKHQSPYCGYAFKVRGDALNTFIDARHSGNLTRFINHGPSANHLSKQGQLANIQATHHYLNGLEFIKFQTKRAIEAGEQLLVNYGEDYFHSSKPIEFKPSGKTIGNWKGKLKLLIKKTKLMRILAFYGIESAQTYLIGRLLLILLLFITSLELFKIIIP